MNIIYLHENFGEKENGTLEHLPAVDSSPKK